MLIQYSGCTVLKEIHYVAPTRIPGTKRIMKSPGFWVDRNPYPDKIILTAQEINTFNNEIQNILKIPRDIIKFPRLFSGKILQSDLTSIITNLKNKVLYFENDKKISPSFFQKMIKKINITKINSEITVRFGLITHYCSQRFLPIDEGLYETPGEIDFDELQNSSLDLGTPLAILHESSDKQWYYILSPLTSGWIRKENIAIGTIDDIKNFLTKKPFIIITEAKGDIFLKHNLTHFYDYVRMGIRLPLQKKSYEEIVQVTLPVKNDNGTLSFKPGFVNKSEINTGFLPYTPRTIFLQAFKLLNAPYGWGGMYGEQDCSRFIQEIFATIGIYLPRNSSQQAQVGSLIGTFTKNTPSEEKIHVLDNKAIGGITLLYLKGHIMLYLGAVEDKLYAIHATWAYRERFRGDDIIRVINRVAITDLSLGEHSKKGSLLDRLVSVRIIGQPARGGSPPKTGGQAASEGKRIK